MKLEKITTAQLFKNKTILYEELNFFILYYRNNTLCIKAQIFKVITFQNQNNISNWPT